MDRELDKCDKCGSEIVIEHGASYCPRCNLSNYYHPFPVELTATRESNLAPLWLIFPKDIINTSKIHRISIEEGSLTVYMDDKSKFVIPVKDLETTWKALQTVFAEGVAKKS